LSYLKELKLTFKNGNVLIIKTQNMNFNAKDLLYVCNDIKAKLPKVIEEDTLIEDK